MNWHKEVYKQHEIREDWDILPEIKKHFIKVFKGVCQSCRKRKKYNELSVHHIIPKEDGGSEDGENLILLCRKCHDEIECNIDKYKSRSDILYAFCDDKSKHGKKITGHRWQEWVYGSAKNPLKQAQ